MPLARSFAGGTTPRLGIFDSCRALVPPVVTAKWKHIHPAGQGAHDGHRPQRRQWLTSTYFIPTIGLLQTNRRQHEISWPVRRDFPSWSIRCGLEGGAPHLMVPNTFASFTEAGKMAATARAVMPQGIPLFQIKAPVRKRMPVLKKTRAPPRTIKSPQARNWGLPLLIM